MVNSRDRRKMKRKGEKKKGNSNQTYLNENSQNYHDQLFTFYSKYFINKI